VDKLVHNCYTIETYKISYAYNLTPPRSRVHLEMMNVVTIRPPLYTKVMGMSKKIEGKLHKRRRKME
jgi:hypothetical protein